MDAGVARSWSAAVSAAALVSSSSSPSVSSGGPRSSSPSAWQGLTDSYVALDRSQPRRPRKHVMPDACAWSLAVRPPNGDGQAVHVHGGPSHVDPFDYKPKLQADHGKELPFAKPRVQFAQTGSLMASPYKWKQHGGSGQWVSEIFPETAKVVDDLCFIKSLHGSNPAHGAALLDVRGGQSPRARLSCGHLWSPRSGVSCSSRGRCSGIYAQKHICVFSESKTLPTALAPTLVSQEPSTQANACFFSRLCSWKWCS